MNQEAKNNRNKPVKQSTASLVKNVLFIITVAAMFIIGFYSLFLASVSANKTQTFTTENLLRTVDPSDTDKINRALGHSFDMDFVFVVLDTSVSGTNPNLEFSVRSAALTLADSGLTSSVRILYPEDNDFTEIAAQNDINSFPAVLAVKKEGGIIQIMNDHSEEYLLYAYHSIWGKTSDCSDDKSAVY